MLDRGSAALARVAAVAGLSGVFIIVAGSLTTALAYVGEQGEAYSPLNHWISELGDRVISTLAVAFNLGLIIGGLEFAILMFALSRLVPGRAATTAGAVGSVGGLFGALVGVFPTDGGSPHTLVAYAFFYLTCAAVAIFAFDHPPHGPTAARSVRIAALATVAALLALTIDVAVGGAGDLLPPDPRPAVWHPAVLEWLALGGLLVWVALVSVRLIRSTGAPR